jgi:hypothetical protein
MRRFHLALGILPLTATVLLAGCFAAAAFLAGCSGGPQGGAALSPSAIPLSLWKDQGLHAQRDAALTMPHFVQRPLHPDRSRSWMAPNAKNSKELLYVGDDETNDVYVYDYKSGKSVGTLTGFSAPYGECVDAKGDVYIANFDDENAVEYGHGGTKVLNTYDVSGGTPIGCSVDAKGDVAVTSFDPAEVTVFAGGNPDKGTTYSASSTCYYMWTMGYDHSGNLIAGGETEYGGDELCALLSGRTSIIALSSSSGSIYFPGGTMWDGKYIALTDQEVGDAYETGIIRATLKGTTLTYVSATDLGDDCYGDYTDDVNPFIVGKKNTPVNGKEGNANVGPNLWCQAEGKGGKLDYWHYPGGGMPYKSLSNASEDPYGAAVSIAP